MYDLGGDDCEEVDTWRSDFGSPSQPRAGVGFRFTCYDEFA